MKKKQSFITISLILMLNVFNLNAEIEKKEYITAQQMEIAPPTMANGVFVNDKGEEIDYEDSAWFAYEQKISEEMSEDTMIKINAKPIVTISRPTITLLDANGNIVNVDEERLTVIFGKNKPYKALTTKSKAKIKLLHALHKDSIDMYLAMNPNTPLKILISLSKSKNEIVASNAINNELFMTYKRNGVLAFIKKKKVNQKMKAMVEKIKAMYNSTDLNDKELLKLSIQDTIYSNVKLYLYYNQMEINRFMAMLNIKDTYLDLIYTNNLIYQDFETSLNLVNNKRIKHSTLLKTFKTTNNIFIKNRADFILQKSNKKAWEIVVEDTIE
jgi:hypothetical protein